MQIDFTEDADKHLKFFIKSGNKSILKKVAELIKAIDENPFEGIGKPEPLKYEMTGLWSRRINQEHRLIYEITTDIILIHSIKGHYK
ncbi:toxin YoeB [Pedobacter sp. UYP30]|uniref:Txe/YoeB family addiction module toxin n=1 Tax=Pedobacter sp. UYP30 TaxID=1756400 RepID=UPI003398B217